jgi:hypothetical protein
LVLILLAACSSPGYHELPASQEEINGDMRFFMNCLAKQLPRFDDGRSDASTVAYALADACPQQAEILDEAMTRAQSPNVQAGIRERLPSLRREAALKVVLNVRASSK